MIRKWVLVLLLAVCECFDPGPKKGPIIEVEQGFLQGKEVISVLEKPYYSFQGIPYAKPPMESLRFKDAKPPGSWDGIRDATKEGCICTQNNLDKSEGCEDCLFVNVYTPKLPGVNSEALSVMVWIHGGGFNIGSGNDNDFGPDFLVAEDVVLVTINYRVSVFGFLFLRKAAPGNVGLKDQVTALRWVKNNIAAFNGDPHKVTIFGESAGGASVHWHMLSPMSRGLFHSAISESGAVMNPWALAWAPYDTSRRLADAVGCTHGDDEKIVECLRHVNTTDLMKASKGAPTQRDHDRLFMYPFTPTLAEEKVPGVETFVTGVPEQLIKQGCQHDVPYLAGINNQEWVATIGQNISDFASKQNLRIIDSDWEKYVFPETRLPDDSTMIPEAMEELRGFFLRGKPLTNETLQGFGNMITDLLFGEGIYYNMKYIAKSRKSPIFFYSFIVDRELNNYKVPHLNFPGATHSDELGYLFQNHVNSNVSFHSLVAFIIRQRMVRLWTNFAKYGNPTPYYDPLIGEKWKPYTNMERNYLEIGDELKTYKDLNKRRVQFWEDFYKKYGAKREKKWSSPTCRHPSIFSLFNL